MRKFYFAGAALAALLAASCGPGYDNEDDVEDVEELPAPNDLDEPDDDGVEPGSGASQQAAAAANAAPASAAAQTLNLSVQESGEYGPYLTDANGRPLYMFTADTPAVGESSAMIACTGACLEAWPPATTAETPLAGAGTDQSLAGTTEHSGGLVATYAGWPLYYFARDGGGGGEPMGQDISSFGGMWKLVTPDGKKAGDANG